MFEHRISQPDQIIKIGTKNLDKILSQEQTTKEQLKKIHKEILIKNLTLIRKIQGIKILRIRMNLL